MCCCKVSSLFNTAAFWPDIMYLLTAATWLGYVFALLRGAVGSSAILRYENNITMPLWPPIFANQIHTSPDWSVLLLYQSMLNFLV